jgi:glycosyltransferase involved in cell wall biosynthesis
LLSESEGLPNAVLEYMASGLPVIVTRLPFINELVREGHNGLVIDDPSAEKVADAMLYLALSADARREMGRAGRAIVKDGAFHPDREAHDTQVLLTSIVSAGNIGTRIDHAGQAAVGKR